MRPPALCAAFFVLVLVGGCAHQPATDTPTKGPSTKPSFSPIADNVTLAITSSTVQTPSAGLMVDYRVTNTGSSPILANDRLSAHYGGGSVEPTFAYVLADGEVGVISKRTLNVTGLDYTPAAQGTVVAPGATHRGQAIAALPLKAEGREFTSWRFCLGITPKVSEEDLVEGGAYATIPHADRAAPYAQRFVCSDDRSVPAS